MESEGLICPILKETCLKEGCAWYTPMGQCSIAVLGSVLSMKGKSGIL